jgi:hypothetical protein
MTVERWIRVLAGTFILLSLALGVEGSPLFVSKWCAGVHRLRRREPVPVRLQQRVPAGLDAAQAGRARRPGRLRALRTGRGIAMAATIHPGAPPEAAPAPATREPCTMSQLSDAGQMAAVRKALDSAYVRMTVCFMEQELQARFAPDAQHASALTAVLEDVQSLLGKVR